MKKYELKKDLMKSMDLCFEKLYEILSPASEYYNDIIHLRMRYQRINDDQNRGIISPENRNLELNRIQIALIEFIDELSDSDLEEANGGHTYRSNSDEKHFTHFWKPFFENRTSIVIGTYYGERWRAWEASTLMATGDAIALGTIMGVLNNVGVKDIDVVPTYNFSGDRYQNNLILLGGPDANEVTRKVYEQLDTNFKFGNPDHNEITLYDSKEHESYLPSHNSKNEVIGDYGLVFKTKNPFNPDAQVILLAGCFGFGTCAAAQVFEANQVLQEMEEKNGGEFEAIVRSAVIKDWVQKPRVLKAYRL